MAKYLKKPIVIEAQRWFPPGDLRHDPSMLTVRKGNSVNPPDYLQLGDLYCAMPAKDLRMGNENIYMIKTLEGSMKVSPGDWVIIGVAGEKYACKPDIFAAIYEAVD